MELSIYGFLTLSCDGETPKPRLYLSLIILHLLTFAGQRGSDLSEAALETQYSKG